VTNSYSRFALRSLIAVALLCWVVPPRAGAQNRSTDVAVPAASAPRPAGRPWSIPRTPWGDPDLQGTFTNSNEYATPLERPDRFAGRRIEDITGDEFRQGAQQQMIDALPGGRVRGPDEWWLQNLDLGKRSQPWSIVDPPDGRIPALTPEGQKRTRGRVRSSFVGGPFNGPEDLNYLERCISRGVPGSMIPVMYSNNYQILQTPGAVVIIYEIIHDTRIIPLDGRPHVGPAIRQHMGDARGRWEGDTLVVETTNFRPQTAYRRGNADRMRVVERFRRLAPETIAWSATIDDPTTWTKPWTLSMPLTVDDTSVLPFDCHEHNYGLVNILSAARAEDRAREAGTGDTSK
jgi:hypothetical protein